MTWRRSKKRFDHGRERVDALPKRPLLVALLQFPRGDVVQDRVPEDVGHRIVGLGDATRAAYDHRQFSLIIDGGEGVEGALDGLAGSDDGRGRLREDDGDIGNFIASDRPGVEAASPELGGMRVIVFADAEDVATRHRDRREGRDLADRHRGSRECRLDPRRPSLEPLDQLDHARGETGCGQVHDGGPVPHQSTDALAAVLAYWC